MEMNLSNELYKSKEEDNKTNIGNSGGRYDKSNSTKCSNSGSRNSVPSPAVHNCPSQRGRQVERFLPSEGNSKKSGRSKRSASVSHQPSNFNRCNRDNSCASERDVSNRSIAFTFKSNFSNRAHPTHNSCASVRNVVIAKSKRELSSKPNSSTGAIPKDRRTSLSDRNEPISEMKQNPVNAHKQERNIKFGYHRLKALSERNEEEIVLALTDKKKDFFSLTEEKLRPDMIMLLGVVMAKISSSSMTENKAVLLAYSVNSNLLEMFSTHCCDIVAKDLQYKTDEIIKYFQNIGVFYRSIVEILPNTAGDMLKEHLNKSIMSLQSLKILKNISIEPELEKYFTAISTELLSVIKSRKNEIIKTRREKERCEWKPPGTDFREVSVFPLQQDLLNRSEIRLSQVVLNGSYTSVEHYLNVHFHLMREDFIIPLRNGIMNFIEQNSNGSGRLKRIENVRFYKQVKFCGQCVEGDTLVSEVLFDPFNRYKRIVWERSKRFKFGSLLCFSKDNFKTLFLAQIVDRDVKKLNRGILRCEIINDVKENLFEADFTMAESEVYFESYQYVLKGLKNFNEVNFPLKEYIVNVSSEVELPNYLVQDPEAWYFYEDNAFQVLNRTTWLGCNELKVNNSQLDALHAALTQKLVIIQGPPGTGKTYLGLIIAKILLGNANAWRNFSKGPILVVCYTNHALDQFLEGMLSFTNEIVRVGGQSRSDKMADYNLRVKRRKKGEASAVSHIEAEINQYISEINKNDRFLKEIFKNRGIVSLQHLGHAMSDRNKSWFIVKGTTSDSILVEWLCDGSYYHVYADSTAELNGDDFSDGNGWMAYACTLSELHEQISNIEKGLRECNELYVEELLCTKELYLQRFLYLKRMLTEPVYVDMEIISHLEKQDKLEKIPFNHRWMLYHHWVSVSIQRVAVNLNDAKENYRRSHNCKKEILDRWSLLAMQQSDVVGMTTTGAAKHQDLLQKLGAKIVIIEEAAEVMESHVIVSLSAKCQQLILIGDHKQLRPSPAVYELSKKYHLDVSLFERMLMNEMPCNTLNIQHRMRPEIADLIIPAIYPSLENHESVLCYENILGVTKNLFFITHDNPEVMVMDDISKKNTVEAKFMIAFGRHLLLQGYQPNQITILTTYIGQMFCLMEEREKYLSMKSVKITCVDNYQGEENDIILLSLVRNNSEGKIGFLIADNRVCVALSRAKKGLFIMGNMDMLCTKSSLWQKIKEVLEKKEAIGTHLKLRCINHENQYTDVCREEDFVNIREGGCTKMCEAVLPCGHICKKMCHMMGHDDYKCREKCGRKMCINDHKCEKNCWEECGECTVPLECHLPCGHTVTLPCHMDPTEYKCPEIVKVELPDCNHTVEKQCHVPLQNARCTFPCDSRLPCGHICERKCHINNDPEHLNYQCLRPCARKNSECKEEHMCQRQCFEECSLCTFEVRRKLTNCDHFYKMKCSDDPALIICNKPCKKILACTHKCPLKCHEECGGCQVLTEKEIPDCKHKIKIECCKIPERRMCKSKCERNLKCGHECQGRCRIPCEEIKCTNLSKQSALSPCGHRVELLCYELTKGFEEQSLLQRCDKACSTMLECSHQCKGTCGTCFQGRVHLQCQEKCGRNLICGHQCTVSCSQSCPPCKKKCFIKCDHSRCKKNCGFPCVSCKEKCVWICEHYRCNKRCGNICDRPPCNEPCKKVLKCGHPCIGFCGEKCPSLCRICDMEKLEEVQTFFGSDNENARFVLLPECNHVIDSESLDKWLLMEDDSVKMKACPICNTPIQTAYRYGNIVKKNLMNVGKVKSKVYGSAKRKGKINNISKDIAIMMAKPEFQSSKGRFSELAEQLKSAIKNFVDVFLLCSLEARSEFVLTIDKNYSNMKGKLDGTKQRECTEAANKLINIILRNLDFITTQEHFDITGECIRFQLLLQLSALESTEGFKNYSKTKWYDNYQECRNIIYSHKRFPREKHDDLYNRINDVYKILTRKGVGISRVEMSSVVSAINLHQGHWKICPNGHVYVIADCGFAMQQGNCNECGARIGGSDHHLLSTNRELTHVPQGL